MKTKRAKILPVVLLIIIGSVAANAQYDYNYNPGPRRYQQRPRPQRRDVDSGFNPTGYLMVNVGAGIPMAAFAVRTGTGYGSYALTGDQEAISAGILLGGTNLGISLMYGYSDNPFDLNGYVNSLVFSNRTYQYYGVYGQDYVENNIMGGIFYTWPVKRISFDVRAMVGVMICAFPEVTYAANATDPNATNDYQWDYAASGGVAFAYDLGVGIRCRLRRSYCLSLNVDYLGGTSTYSTQQTYIDDLGNQYVSPASGSLPISLLNISLGIGYQFK